MYRLNFQSCFPAKHTRKSNKSLGISDVKDWLTLLQTSRINIRFQRRKSEELDNDSMKGLDTVNNAES